MELLQMLYGLLTEADILTKLNNKSERKKKAEALP